MLGYNPDRWFYPPNLKRCLVLFAASRVFRAPVISGLCRRYLLDHLPTSFEHINLVEQYREDAQVTTTVLSLCTSFQITPPLPWAFYAFYVHLNRAQPPANSPLVAPAMIGLAKIHKEKLKEIYKIGVSVVPRWNKSMAAFYEGDCIDKTNSLGDCLRTENHGVPEQYMLALEDICDPIGAMFIVLDTSEAEELCNSCKTILRDDVVEFMRNTYLSLCNVINVMESRR
ncbi:hypothetical protein RhiLY_01098 [Ceratobasidium sp. AG-Ba]|nr:hypothetical protein RhiLY_01098 [Ceratobasidium sp. AG-Ba]